MIACAVGGGFAAWVASPSATGLDGHVAARLSATSGMPVAATDLPPVLRDAVVATEDERFYRHHGIDVIGVLRALPYDLTHLSLAQGASTITEQVGKVLYLGGNDHDPWRKLKDVAVALKLEHRYTKAQILAAYLNSAYFGAGAYGIGAASERYFGLPPRRLDVAQVSLLAGLIQSPSRYDPFLHPTLARARQADVLRSLVRNGYLTEPRAAAVLARPLQLHLGAPLRGVAGVDLSTGAAFVWWELAVGAVLAVTAAVVLLTTRRRPLPAMAPVFLLRAMLFLVVLAGAAVIVRSFRTA